MKVIIFSFIFLCSLRGFSQNVLLENLQKQDEKKIRLSFSANHFDGFGDDRAEPSTVFGLMFNYQISNHLALVASTRITKRYYVNFSSESEVALSDPYLGLRHSFKQRILWGATPMLSYGFLFPVSEFSSLNDVMGRFYVGGSASWSLLRELTVTVSGDGVYQINKYSTTRAISSGFGGRLLPSYSLSGRLSLDYSLGRGVGFKSKLLKSMFLSLGGSYGWTSFEKFDVSPVESTSFVQGDFEYSLGATLSVSPLKNLYLSLGYGHDANIETVGRVEYNLFDSVLTRWRLGLRYMLKI